MKKSGLQKQISSIFNDVPAPQADAGGKPFPKLPSEPVEDLLQERGPSDGDQPEPEQPSAPEPVASVHTPSVPAMRPKPLPRIQQSPPKTGPSMTDQLKKIAAGGSGGKIDGRQKKMAVLMAFLTVMFAGVLFVSLNGLGQKKTTPPEPSPEPVADVPAKIQSISQWQMPEALPSELRDPVQPVIARIEVTVPDDQTVAGGTLTVTGIVYSQNNPSAIVNGEFVRLGDTISGATVVTINRKSIEFEKDGERWEQQVNR